MNVAFSEVQKAFTAILWLKTDVLVQSEAKTIVKIKKLDKLSNIIHLVF